MFVFLVLPWQGMNRAAPVKCHSIRHESRARCAPRSFRANASTFSYRDCASLLLLSCNAKPSNRIRNAGRRADKGTKSPQSTHTGVWHSRRQIPHLWGLGYGSCGIAIVIACADLRVASPLASTPSVKWDQGSASSARDLYRLRFESKPVAICLALRHSPSISQSGPSLICATWHPCRLSSLSWPALASVTASKLLLHRGPPRHRSPPLRALIESRTKLSCGSGGSTTRASKLPCRVRRRPPLACGHLKASGKRIGASTVYTHQRTPRVSSWSCPAMETLVNRLRFLLQRLSRRPCDHRLEHRATGVARAEARDHHQRRYVRSTGVTVLLAAVTKHTFRDLSHPRVRPADDCLALEPPCPLICHHCNSFI